MTDEEVMTRLNSNTPWNKARQKFSNACAHIEQESQQRTPLSPIEIRRMEFFAVAEIAKEFGVLV